MAVTDLRRIAAIPRPDPRTILGIALAAAAAMLVLLITRPQPMQGVLVAAGDLPAGTPLSGASVDVRYVPDPTGLVVGTEIGELDGWVLAVPLSSGEPLLPSLVRPPVVAVASEEVSLEVEIAHAALGRIHPGDMIDIIATTSSGGEATTRIVAEGVYVLDVESGSTTTSPSIRLLLAADDGLALDIVTAARAGAIDVVRVGR